MVSVLSDASLYEFTGGEPPDVETLRRRYEAQVAGPDDTSQAWLNWIIRLGGSGAAVGFVQATVAGESADIAWVVGAAWQRNGYAVEAATAMCNWLRVSGVASLTAHIHPDHLASAGVASACGLRRTDRIDADGECIWTSDGS